MRFELSPQEFGSANIANLAKMLDTEHPVNQVNQWKFIEKQLQVNPAITKHLATIDATALLNYRLRSVDKCYLAPCHASDKKCCVVYVVVFG